MEAKRSSKMRSFARVLSRRSVVDASLEKRSSSSTTTSGSSTEGTPTPALPPPSPSSAARSSMRRPPASPSYPGAVPPVPSSPRNASDVGDAAVASAFEGAAVAALAGSSRRLGRNMSLRRFGRSAGGAAAGAAGDAPAGATSPSARASHPGAVPPPAVGTSPAGPTGGRGASIRSSSSSANVRGSKPEALGAGKIGGSYRELSSLLRRGGSSAAAAAAAAAGGNGGGGGGGGGGLGAPTMPGGGPLGGVTHSDAYTFEEEPATMGNLAFRGGRGGDVWDGDDGEPSILRWRKKKGGGPHNDILRTAMVRKREINAKLIAEFPKIVLSPYGEGDWARDVVVFLHNAMRREFIDLYALLDVMQRKKSLLTHDVIDSFFDWWGDFQSFCVAAINAETDEVFPPITHREPITNHKVRQSSRMLTNGRFLVILQKVTDYQSAFNRNRPAGEMLPGLLALVDELSFIHPYWAALEELVPPAIAVHFRKRDKALWERRIAAHVRRGNNYDLNMALLSRWLSTAAETKWKVANLKTAEHFSYGTWVREAERVHYRILKNMENRLVSEDESERERSIGVAMAVAPEWRERLEQSKTSTVELSSSKEADPPVAAKPAAKPSKTSGAAAAAPGAPGATTPAAPTGAVAAAGTESRTNSSLSAGRSVGGEPPSPPPEKPASMVPRPPVALTNSSMA